MVRLISKLFSRKQDKRPAVPQQVLIQEVSDKEAGNVSGGCSDYTNPACWGGYGWGGS